MRSVNINLVAHAFTRDIRDGWSQDMQWERIRAMLAELQINETAECTFFYF